MRLPSKAIAVALLIAGSPAAHAQVVARDVPEAAKREQERDTDRLGWAVPDFAKAQTGGFVGMAAFGLGYAAVSDIFNASLLYGYTPKWHAGTTVHSLHLGLSVRPFEIQAADFRIVPLYAGAGLLFNPDSDLFIRVPERYQSDGYYHPTALHWTAHLGVELDYIAKDGWFERHGLYFEAVVLDSYVFAYFENSETLSPFDVIGSAVGYRAAF